MEGKDRNSTSDVNQCKYKNKKIVKTIDDINEFVKTYPRTNRELNTYIIKKDRGSEVSLLKSFVFYIFTQITSILAVCLVIFCIGFLIGNHISSKSSVVNSVIYNSYSPNDIGAQLYVGKLANQNERQRSQVHDALGLDLMINFNFDYNNLFMGTLIGKVLLFYYPANDIGVRSEEYCYRNSTYSALAQFMMSPKRQFPKWQKNHEELYAIFAKENSLIFLNYAMKMKREAEITYINDLLFENLNAYPIGGADITISPGIMQGINSINALVSINHIITDKTLLQHLINDCKKGRIYVQLHFASNQIKTILFRFQPQTGIFLPFRIPCEIKSQDNGLNNEFRLSVIKNYNVQKTAIKNINFFIN
ncbi:conserved Plasmodium protein, unknown function [Plasmodium knowlesi strain H]|uniref:Uncharacterized protein n=3 Tax=Plasmodium knowlesi TaxID=5850 RepID=A0A5K1UQ16_PLAKH|nr:conserved Plasmodium protein, unknown function [Plasmodium knowlesi strain H]OTN66960.1 Uncharacterized protein PKNOH_S07444300 [Plasmodium knowlesi]CAA9988570.1 conserved Plasmodium protein, unknown function [Plasmodium knowlesi strain H]SBO21372.1 conserved Plasmodium protein, unknown function [Plasmodium knowlesi strain H]SBO21829.1 conserved Plasmodium protein, unknown function [Plasmodium knowlesi strain H]VVS78044.1 conserved Plasmodium protein, unknown function [Plasmodium knowlesi s|eukprot:XP_002259546.1 hypothetical protein, conserved in Plasmodium species [Plasmodium knowlesi strain H]